MLELYRHLIAKREPLTADCSAPFRFTLQRFDDLHGLDVHALNLLARLDVHIQLTFNEPPPPYILAGLPQSLKSSTPDSIYQSPNHQSPNHQSPKQPPVSIPYRCGAILNCFLETRGWAQVWHDYLTSRDAGLPCVRHAGATLPARFPHLRLAFVTGADLYHQASFYQAHEDYEALWMRLDGHTEEAEKHLTQGLIQLCGAHIHLVKARPREARKLYCAAAQKLESLSDCFAWLDVRRMLDEAAQTFSRCDDLTAAQEDFRVPRLPFRLTHRHIARKHL